MVTYQVTVTEKRIIHTRICVPVSGMWFSETFRYEVHFTPLSGKTIVVYIKEDEYKEITLHSRGTLSMQGTRFIRYEPLR